MIQPGNIVKGMGKPCKSNRAGMTNCRAVVICFILLLTGAVLTGCNGGKKDAAAVQAVIKRYDQLLIEGYRSFNMSPMKAVTTKEQAEKLYFHMAALAEGKLRMESTLKSITFKKIDFPKPDEAAVETKEVWDFTHVNIESGKKFAEEKDFIYEMGYILKKQGDRWIITNVNTISGKPTTTVIPWPEIDRKGNMKRSTSGAEGNKPAGHP